LRWAACATSVRAFGSEGR